MARAATSRLKVNPPLGRMPVLQFMTPGELAIDPTYQRSIESSESQALIRKIAQYWNWDLCQMLVVARRPDGTLYVIDGQHRLEAAKLRGDIMHLPCVVGDYASTADEAASFVHLNQQRRPLGALDLFKAALASEDPEAVAIWPGIVGVCAEAMRGGKAFDPAGFASLTAKLGSMGQTKLRKLVLARSALHPDMGQTAAAIQIVRELHWPDRARVPVRRAIENRPQAVEGGRPDEQRPGLQFQAGADGKAWCDQCDMRVTLGEAEGCKSRWCSLRVREAA